MENKSLLTDVLSVLVPASLSNFNLVSVTEHPTYIEFRMEEKAELIPSSLVGKTNIVLDGFCNPVELQSFLLKDKPVYFKVYRRRWRESSFKVHHSNQYNLHPSGVKATFEFASFLKMKLDKHLGNITPFGDSLLIDNQKLWRWYHDH